MNDTQQIDDGGPAYPMGYHPEGNNADHFGMPLRDWLAGSVQADDRLVKCVRAMDDSALELFALYPTLERDEHITEIEFTSWNALPSEVAKIARRLELESRAIARVRYMQADAMLAARKVGGEQ